MKNQLNMKFFIAVMLMCNTILVFSQTTTALLPDLQTVVPTHLQIQNKQQREYLRFSNGVANTGQGDLRLKPRFPLNSLGTQDAIQELLDTSRNVVSESVVSSFEFHPTHNHWHIDNVALYELKIGSQYGPVYGSNSIKTTYCLIDWYKLEGNSNTKSRNYWECNGEYQGISPGWVDQYHHSLPGQWIDITGAPPGLYYLVSTANPDGTFIEENYFNNTAWVSFILSRDSSGNPKIKIVGNSYCDSPSMCGQNIPNR
jgi:hypothetical protein